MAVQESEKGISAPAQVSVSEKERAYPFVIQLSARPALNSRVHPPPVSVMTTSPVQVSTKQEANPSSKQSLATEKDSTLGKTHSSVIATLALECEAHPPPLSVMTTSPVQVNTILSREQKNRPIPQSQIPIQEKEQTRRQKRSPDCTCTCLCYCT